MKYNSRKYWKNIKKAIARGQSRKEICDQFALGQKKYYRIRKSSTYEEFLEMTKAATRERQAQKERARSEQKLNEIINNSSYNRKPYPTLDEIYREDAERTMQMIANVFFGTIISLGLAGVIFLAYLSIKSILGD